MHTTFHTCGYFFIDNTSDLLIPLSTEVFRNSSLRFKSGVLSEALIVRLLVHWCSIVRFKASSGSHLPSIPNFL